MIEVVGLDGDDTLWHSETQFVMTQDRFRELVADYADPEDLDARLLDRERANLPLFGYGVKGFTISMIETAIEVSGGDVPVRVVQSIIDLAKDMLDHPVDLLDGVIETVPVLAEDYRVVIITKGDLFHQESKVARSGLVDHVWWVEIVAEKDPPTYRRFLDRHEIDPAEFVMVGNSVRSDILPVLEVGGRAVHVPYDLTWELEHAEPDRAHEGYWEVASIADVPALLGSMP